MSQLLLALLLLLLHCAAAVNTPQRVAVLIVGELRGFIANGTWISWAEHVITPLRAAALSVDTFLCTSPDSRGVEDCSTYPSHESDQSAVPASLRQDLALRKWVRCGSAADMGLHHFDCTLRRMGCRDALSALWQRRRHSRMPPEHAAPSGYFEWLRNHSGNGTGSVTAQSASEFVNMRAYPWPKDYLALGCARLATMAARTAHCFETAARHARQTDTRAASSYDWYMFGRPDLAWFRVAPLPAQLRPDAVSLRARELWGGSGAGGAFDISDEHMSYFWGNHACTGAACSRHSTGSSSSQPCLLVDDAWAWVPQRHALTYFAAGGGCDAQGAITRWPTPPPPPPLLPRSTRRRTDNDSDAPSPPWRDWGLVLPRASWSGAALRTMYNGEGLLTARLMQARVPIDVVAASLRFWSPKRVWYWEVQKTCAQRPCATLTKKRCAS